MNLLFNKPMRAKYNNRSFLSINLSSAAWNFGFCLYLLNLKKIEVIFFSIVSTNKKIG